jgi:hypothetical protein
MARFTVLYCNQSIVPRFLSTPIIYYSHHFKIKRKRFKIFEFLVKWAEYYQVKLEPN